MCIHLWVFLLHSFPWHRQRVMQLLHQPSPASAPETGGSPAHPSFIPSAAYYRLRGYPEPVVDSILMQNHCGSTPTSLTMAHSIIAKMASLTTSRTAACLLGVLLAISCVAEARQLLTSGKCTSHSTFRKHGCLGFHGMKV